MYKTGKECKAVDKKAPVPCLDCGNCVRENYCPIDSLDSDEEAEID